MTKIEKPKRGSPIEHLLRDSYTEPSLKPLTEWLARHRTYELTPRGNGLFAATGSLEEGSLTGYQNAWIRDNVMIANSFRLRGILDVAKGTAQGLTNYFAKHSERFRKIIANPSLKENVQERPHVRFDAATLGELHENWAHAQNDALGYALWLRFAMANSERSAYPMAPADWDAYALFPLYFQAIEFWHDRDSGSWEETRKVNSSSIGAVVAGLEEMQKSIARLCQARERLPEAITGGVVEAIDQSIKRGRESLAKSLPFESPPERMMDGAVLFSIYPVDAVKERQMQDSILHLLEARLQGPMGIRRYLGDSYFCQDYDKWFPPEEQAADFSNSIAYRDALLQPGCEAQWTLFDPVISVIYGDRYRVSKKLEDLEQQTFYFNRSLRQLTPEGQCPELYYLRRGEFVPNGHTPLAWTQANQALALHYMERSLSRP
jgi:GH15 family glucan-1,4-alpha-glucosidase